MKRSGPLKRNTPLKRGKPLKRTGSLKRGKPLSRKPTARARARKAAEGPLTPAEWRLAAWEMEAERQGVSPGRLRCPVSGVRLDWNTDDVHHPLEKGILKGRSLFDRMWDARNSLCVARPVHVAHTSAMKRIPREVLSPQVWEFCEEVGEWAISRVERTHPATEGKEAE